MTTAELPQRYSTLSVDIPVDHGLPEDHLEMLRQRFIADGVLRVCQLAGLLTGLRDTGILDENDFSGKAVNLGVGTGADTVASRILGLESIGIDDRKMTEGFLLGSWCPIDEFVVSPYEYSIADATIYLGELETPGLAMITAFDSAPSLFTPELPSLIHARLRPDGKFVTTQRDLSSSGDRTSDISFSEAGMVMTPVPPGFSYQPMNLVEELLSERFSDLRDNQTFVGYLAQTILPDSCTDLVKRDAFIEVWRRSD